MCSLGILSPLKHLTYPLRYGLIVGISVVVVVVVVVVWQFRSSRLLVQSLTPLHFKSYGMHNEYVTSFKGIVAHVNSPNRHSPTMKI
jgi:hypothetical protein